MSTLRAIPRALQRDEPWTNGAGSTTVILREPDAVDWRVRISIAKVDREGAFSELLDTRRVLVPLDKPMLLRFADGRELRAARFEAMHFDGDPAPTGLLPEGPTRDFNLMLRGDAHGEVLPCTLSGSMTLPLEPGLHWLVYLDSGRATIRSGTASNLALEPHDAALVTTGGGATRTAIEGSGEIVLVKLYA